MREDEGDIAAAFALYADGARLNRTYRRHDTAGPARRRRGITATFTKTFFEKSAGLGASDPAPIFIVGLPRSGSTLLEQILASHPAIEGTGELPYLPQIDRALLQRPLGPDGRHPAAELSAVEAEGLGQDYLFNAAVHRRLHKPFFTDKNVGNFQHIALIHLILSAAKIIDVRRHPMASGAALWRHQLSTEWSFPCSLEDIGDFYREYVALMDHFDTVLPGRVHRVVYEDLVDDTEGEVRRLLDHCGLAFDDACLRFDQTPRAILTPSALQVRRPIYRDGLEYWRRFEPWLEPLRAALGPALESWRGAPRA